MNKKLLKEIKSGNTSYFYNSRTWRNKRKQIINRDNNECQMCKKQGRVSKGETVHHIKHLKDYPTLALADDNLITLCFHHHELMHPEKFIHERKAELNREKW